MTDNENDIQNLMMPNAGEAPDLSPDGLTEKAIQSASIQAEMKDLFGLIFGNLFAFFALIFPPLIASSLDLTAQLRGSNSEPNNDTH